MTLPVRLLAALSLPLLAAPVRAQAGAADDPSRSLAPTRVAAQVGLGAVATPIGFVAGGKLTELVAERMFGVEEPRSSNVALVGGWTGAAVATAGAVSLVGARGPGSGSFPAALGGSVAGGLASLAIVKLLDRDDDEPRGPCRIGCAIAAIATFTLPSIGATWAYDASR